MKARTPKKKRDLRRGFTVAEVIIALTVILIVSAAAAVLTVAQVRAETKAARTITATNMTENAVECFRFACDTAETEEELSVAFESTFGENGCGYALDSKGASDGAIKYTAEHNGVIGVIYIDPPAKTICVSAMTAAGDILVSVENYKG